MHCITLRKHKNCFRLGFCPRPLWCILQCSQTAYWAVEEDTPPISHPLSSVYLAYQRYHFMPPCTKSWRCHWGQCTQHSGRPSRTWALSLPWIKSNWHVGTHCCRHYESTVQQTAHNLWKLLGSVHGRPASRADRIQTEGCGQKDRLILNIQIT